MSKGNQQYDNVGHLKFMEWMIKIYFAATVYQVNKWSSH